MTYHVPCECGKHLQVDAVQAGATVRCRCGRDVAVPSLSELRRLSGEDPYARTTVETIAMMIDEGQLPWGNLCAVSGHPTNEFMTFHIECERAIAEGDDPHPLAGAFSHFMMLGWLGALTRLSARTSRGSGAHLGRDVGVDVPLRVCSEFHPQLRRAGQRKLKQLLSQVPVIEILLCEYPDATITAESSTARA